MIRESSIPYWPNGVNIRGNQIIDPSLHASHQVNEVSLELLKHIDGKRSIKEIVERVSSKHDWPKEQVIGDFLELVAELNSYYLVNIETPFEWAIFIKDRLIAFLVFLKTLQGTKYETKTRLELNPNAAFRSMAWIMTKVYGKYALGVALFTFLLTLFLPVGAYYGPLLSGLSFLAGMLIHEYGHYATFQRRTGGQYRLIMAVRNGGIQLVRPISDRATEIWTSVTGPVIPVVIALLLTPVCVFAPNAELQFALGCIICTNIIHIISLMPFAEDGKRVIGSMKWMPPEQERRDLHG